MAHSYAPEPYFNMNYGFFFVQSTSKWLTEQRKLLKQSDEVDYDVEGLYLHLCHSCFQLKQCIQPDSPV